MASQPIHRAAGYGNAKEVERLIEEDGRRLNARTIYNTYINNMYWTPSGSTPLTVAAITGRTAVVGRLLALGADKGSRNSVGEMAAMYQRPAVVQLLLDAGADFTIHDNQGRTPLDVANIRNNESARDLLEAAAAEPQRPRLLLKARALVDATCKIDRARAGHDDSDQGQQQPRLVTRAERERNAPAAALPSSSAAHAFALCLNHATQHPPQRQTDVSCCSPRCRFSLPLTRSAGPTWAPASHTAPQTPPSACPRCPAPPSQARTPALPPSAWRT